MRPAERHAYLLEEDDHRLDGLAGQSVEGEHDQQQGNVRFLQWACQLKSVD